MSIFIVIKTYLVQTHTSMNSALYIRLGDSDTPCVKLPCLHISYSPSSPSYSYNYYSSSSPPLKVISK